MRLLFIIGSLRKGSFSRQLAEEAERLLEGKAEVSYLGYRDIPYMDQDIEYPAPPEIERMRKEAGEADGIWIFSPEYNYSIPGVLKNLLDWLSRPLVKGDPERISAVTGIPVTLSSVGGKSGGANGRKRLAELMIFMRMRHMEGEEVSVSLSPDDFASGILPFTGEMREKLRSQAERFMSFIGK